MIIDVHAHYHPDAYIEFISGGKGQGGAFLRNLSGSGNRPGQLEARLAAMDRAGVQMQVLSAGASSPYSDKREQACAAARLVNDEYAELSQRYPQRFSAYAALPLPHLDDSLRELERALDQLGMVGAYVTASVLNQSVAAPHFVPLWEELNRRGLPLFVHPAGNSLCAPLIVEHGLTWAIGAPMEDTVITAQLIVYQIPLRYPRVKIIASHLGGALPMVLGRMDHTRPTYGTRFQLTEAPSVTARRMWYDTVAHNSLPALRCAREMFGAARLVFGSDYPLHQQDDHYRTSVNLIREADLSPGEATQILETNARALFPTLMSHANESMRDVVAKA
ncbi:MAG TPA: amidohydrolase family protein [Candidatus Binataceae bacterium]|nr:amidohydrolase family protein [Candidatus Binataceae bacterium]